MKIIFDNEMQKRKFIDTTCPHDIGLEHHCKECDNCIDCYILSDVDMEVKEEVN